MAPSLEPTRWVLAPAPDAARAQALASALGIPLPLASLLVMRGHADEQAARAFLRPELATLADPLSLHGMARAVEIVADAVRRRAPILVHGDYDVDGQCATALLTRALLAAGAVVTPFVPHRMRDGYDFGAAGLARAREVGAALILTCDCGITAVEAVAAARAEGREVVVTDHHLPGAALPPASAVVDPQQPDDTSGLGMLCGTGIAFKLVQALVPALGLPAALPFHLLDLVAVATVADVVPLVGENRVLVRHGLRLLEQSRWVGLQALLASSKLGGKDVRAGQVGFVLAPRLNAAGRIDDATLGLRLLLTDDRGEAEAIALRLEALNAERQQLDQRILDEALAQAEQAPPGAPGLVLVGEGWHPGVVGIVASRVVERYGRPTFLVALEGDTGRGSGRSIAACDLHGALHACDDLLVRWGGHHMAAGLTIRRDRVAAFRERFAARVGEMVPPALLGPEQRIDLELPLAGATAELERLLRHLEPCGAGNPSPVFGTRGVRLEGRAPVGGGRHLRATLDDGASRLAAIAWGWGDRLPTLGPGPFDVAFRLETNTWRDQVTLQAKLMACTPAA